MPRDASGWSAAMSRPTPRRTACWRRPRRREVAEETGLDLAGVPLRYLESECSSAGEGEHQVTVTFVAPAPPGPEPRRDSRELTEVGWWTLTEVEADRGARAGCRG